MISIENEHYIYGHNGYERARSVYSHTTRKNIIPGAIHPKESVPPPALCVHLDGGTNSKDKKFHTRGLGTRPANTAKQQTKKATKRNAPDPVPPGVKK